MQLLPKAGVEANPQFPLFALAPSRATLPTMSFPIFAIARVTSYVGPGTMRVNFKSTGQSLAYNAIMLHDYADALRVRQRAMPQIGSWGVVAFPYGDIRNGVWLGAMYPSQLDALTTTQASGSAPTDPFIDYESHFSGYWHLLDGQGNEARQWPDGSWFSAGNSGALPTVYRHIVDENQYQQQVPFAQSDRIPSPPPTMPFVFKHNSGTEVEVTSGGTYQVAAASGQFISHTAGGTVVAIDTSGNVKIALAAGATLQITDGGGVTDSLVRSSELVAALNTHTHTGVQTGGGNTGTPTTPFTSGAISSNLIGVQS